MNVSGLGLVSAAVIVLTPLAQADKSAPSPEAETRAALKRLAGLYGPAWTLTYESVLTTKEYGPSSGTQSDEEAVHGVLQKPNKFRLEVTQNNKLVGLLVCDGSSVYVYNPALAVYQRQAAPPDLALGGLTVTDKGLARLAAVVPSMAMTPALFSLATRPDFLGTDATAFAASGLTLHGKEALDCAWTEAGATEHLVFNEATGLPLRAIDSSTNKDGTTTDRQEDLTAIQVGAVPLPPSVFEWTPPPGAKPAPGDTPAPTSTAAPAPAPPQATRPLRHRRRRKVPDTGGADSGKTPSGKIIHPAASP